MKLGAEPKKIAILAGLMGVAVWQFASNWGPPSPPPAASSQASRAAARPTPTATPGGQQSSARTEAQGALRRPQAQQQRASSSRRTLREFRPVIEPRRDVDPATIDPSLRTDLLARVRAVESQAGGRNLFQFSAKPIEKVEVKPILPSVPDPVAATPTPGVDGPAGPPPPPAPAPIALKYFGFVHKAPKGERRAFFLDGEEIHVAAEGDLVKDRYKVVRIGVNSVVMEDTVSKREQTIRLEQEVG